jgi:hypothetical protein
MEKSKALEHLTFCEDCGYWRPLDYTAIQVKEEHRGYLGCCNKPYESARERYKDDFCSRGRPKKGDNLK